MQICYDFDMKTHFTTTGLAAMSSMLLFAALVPGFALAAPTAAMVQTNSTGTANDTMSSETISLNSTSAPIKISDRPMAIGHYNTTSENFENSSLQISFAGNTSITIPNSTETVNADTTGNVTIYFSPAGGFLNGQANLSTEDGSESATVSVSELFTSENAPGRGVAYFSTNSTGKLAPLDGKVALTWDQERPDGSTIVSFYEWQSGPTANSSSNATNSSSDNQTSSTTGPSGMTASRNNPNCVNPPGGSMIC
jgi:hypothetical protein